MKNIFKLLLTATFFSVALNAMDEPFICKVPRKEASTPSQQLMQANLDAKEFAAQVESKKKAHQNSADSQDLSALGQDADKDIALLAKLGEWSACSSIVCEYLDGWNPVKVFKGHAAPIRHLFIEEGCDESNCNLQSSDHFVTTDSTGLINVWDPKKSAPAFSYNFNRSIAVIDIKPLWEHTGIAYIAIAFQDDPKNISLYYIQHKNNEFSISFGTQLRGHDHSISQLSFDKDFNNKNIALTSFSRIDTTEKNWDISKGECYYTRLQPRLDGKKPRLHTHCPNCIEYVGKGSSLIVQNLANKKIANKKFTGHDAPITDIWDYCPPFNGNPKDKANKERIITTSRDHTLKIWNTETGECIQTLIGPKKAVTRCKLMDDDTTLVAIADDGCVYMWELIDGKKLNDLVRQKVALNSYNKAKKKITEQTEESDFALTALFDDEQKK